MTPPKTVVIHVQKAAADNRTVDKITLSGGNMEGVGQRVSLQIGEKIAVLHPVDVATLRRELLYMTQPHQKHRKH